MTSGNYTLARQLGFLLALFVGCPTMGIAAIVIAPTLPTSNDPVSVEVVNQYNSAATVTSATITRSGNAFSIAITVTVDCLLPAAPILSSTFNVGPLSPGIYDVVAQIDDVAGTPGCPESSREQVAQFQVSAGTVSVPANTSLGIVATILLLVGAAAAQVRARKA